jgi:hypothetical protein
LFFARIDGIFFVLYNQSLVLDDKTSNVMFVMEHRRSDKIIKIKYERDAKISVAELSCLCSKKAKRIFQANNRIIILIYFHKFNKILFL